MMLFLGAAISKGEFNMLLVLIETVCNSIFPSQKAAAKRQCITVALHGTRFGIDTRFVKQIARNHILAEPRGKPAFVRGLFRHQGNMIPVLDIAALYGTHPLEPGGRSCILIVTLGIGKWRRDIGLMVDEVLGWEEFAAVDLKPVPEVMHRMLQVEIVEGLVQQEKDYLIVLDAWRLVSDAQMEALFAFMRT